MTEEATYLNTLEAARYLGLSAKTLSRYRVSGDGPVFCRFNTRIRYRREDPGRLGGDAPAGLDRGRRQRARGSHSVNARARTTRAIGTDRAGNAHSHRPPWRRSPWVRRWWPVPDVAPGPPPTPRSAIRSDTVQDIVGGTGGQLAAALGRGRGAGRLGAALQRDAAHGRGSASASRPAPAPASSPAWSERRSCEARADR